ncbi:hypothetical protein [Streptomyces zhihengii]
MSDTVKMRLTFPRGKQQPGDTIDVPKDEVHRWKGFATLVDEKPKETEAKASNPTTGSVQQKAAGK